MDFHVTLCYLLFNVHCHKTSSLTLCSDTVFQKMSICVNLITCWISSGFWY